MSNFCHTPLDFDNFHPKNIRNWSVVKNLFLLILVELPNYSTESAEYDPNKDDNQNYINDLSSSGMYTDSTSHGTGGACETTHKFTNHLTIFCISFLFLYT